MGDTAVTTNDTNGGTPSDDLVIAAVASGASFTEAASAAGVSRSTVARRMREVEFRARVTEARSEVVGMVKGQLLGAAPAAIRTLAEVGASASAPPAARVSAARAVLEMAFARRATLEIDAVPIHEYQRDVRAMLDLALRRLPEADLRTFLHEVEHLAAH